MQHNGNEQMDALDDEGVILVTDGPNPLEAAHQNQPSVTDRACPTEVYVTT